ncbi:hypothetical protein VIGAN_08341300, partial [Vigna angularis var. angularis]
LPLIYIVTLDTTVHPCLLMFSCNLLFKNGNLALGPKYKARQIHIRAVSSCTTYKRNSYFSYRICKSFFFSFSDWLGSPLLRETIQIWCLLERTTTKRTTANNNGRQR